MKHAKSKHLKADFNNPAIRRVTPRSVLRKVKDSFTSGWYFHGERASQDRARLVMHNYTSGIISNLIGGSFYTGLLLLMNADDSFIGNMSMIGVAANMIQLFAPLVLERFKRRKTLLIAMHTVAMILNILVLGLIPLAPTGDQAKLTMVAISIAVINLVNAFSSPGINVWHLQSVPPRVRTSYFSLITMTTSAVVAIFNLGGSSLVDVFKANGNEYGGLMLVRMFALALYVFDFWLLIHIKEYPYEHAGECFSMRDLFTLPLKNKLYLRSIAIVMLWNLTANIPGSYYTVYLLKNLNVSYSYIMVINTLNVPILLFFTRMWRNISRGRSPFKVLSIGMSLYLLHYLGLAFVTKETLLLYPITLIWGFIMAIGINLPFSLIPYVNIPDDHQTVFIAFYQTVANLAALIGVAVGKYFITATEDVTLNVLGCLMTNKQLLLLMTAGLMACSMLVVRRIDRITPYHEG